VKIILQSIIAKHALSPFLGDRRPDRFFACVRVLRLHFLLEFWHCGSQQQAWAGLAAGDCKKPKQH
jgi:hypothetical protein